MTEVNTKRYHIRLTGRFYWYDHKSNHSYEFQQGEVVTDPDAIKLIEARGAPVERIKP